MGQYKVRNDVHAAHGTSALLWPASRLDHKSSHTSVSATMEVKGDFFSYKSGVYRYAIPDDFDPKNHAKSGYHSVKVIG